MTRTMTARRGAPDGNRNAFRHGKYSRERLQLYADIRAHIRRGRALVAHFRARAALEGTTRRLTRTRVIRFRMRLSDLAEIDQFALPDGVDRETRAVFCRRHARQPLEHHAEKRHVEIADRRRNARSEEHTSELQSHV